MRGMPNDAEKNPDADKLAELRDMEAKVRRMRDNRNSFRDQGKAMAKKRNAVQDQYKEHREKLDGLKAELDAIHTERNLHRAKRCLLYTSPSPRDQRGSRMPSSA